MNNCNQCGEKPKKSCNNFSKAVVEINNPEKIVLFRKVVIPASIGGRDVLPPAIGKYHNVLLEYEADGSLFLYSSDGIPTQLSTDVTDLQRQLDALGIEIDDERVERVAADRELSNTIEEEVNNRQNADTALSNQITNLDDSLATVAKTGSYNDLSDKPTIGNATLTIKKNGSNVGTFTANATADKNIDISVPTKTSNLVNDGSDGSSQYVESDDLATVATSGSYNDLTNKPTIGNATLTIKRNNTNAGTFTANATTNKSINIAVPTKTSDLTNDGSDGTSTYVETRNLPTVGNATLTITENNTSVGTFTANATSNKTINITSPTKTSDLTNDGADGTSTYIEADDLPTVDTMYSSSSNNAIANSTVTNSLDRNVMTDLTLDSTPSTTTVNLNNTKTNLAYPSSATTSSISLPVASSTQAGVMNSATFDAVTSNTNNINAILNGAVAISNLPASPTQAQLTTAWENETGLTSLINRASVYDVTNNKVWTYYTNDQTWHAASNTSQVTVNTFTNSSEGTIKGSTNDGQVFAESDGTGSVNGWDTLTGNVANNTSKLATIEQGAEVNVQANWTQTNTNADDYIKNKPANLVQDANYVHTDNNFTTTLKDKLNGISAGAEVNVQSDWSQTNTSADDYIKNKPANLVQDANYVHTDNNFTTTLKNKLDGIESGAEVNVQADWAQSDTSADDYIKNKPTIPTVNNATLTIQKNGVNVQTFTANSSTNKTANITVPTAVSELTNDADYATNTALNAGLATKQNTLTAGDNITITGNTISATDTTYTAGNAISIENGVISADVHPADFFDADEDVSDCGSTVNLSETVDSTIKSIELKGDTEQQTYSGANLFDYTDTTSVSTGVTVDDDGWITMTKDNISGGSTSYTNYFCKPMQLAPNTDYAIIIEVKSKEASTEANSEYLSLITGNSADQWGSQLNFRLNELQTNSVYVAVHRTKSDLSSATIGLRTFLATSAGVRNSITFRVSVLADTSVTPETFVYQPYVGGIPAPNPDYPQDIDVVTGEQNVYMHSKNLFRMPEEAQELNGVVFTPNEEGTFDLVGTATAATVFTINVPLAGSGIVGGNEYTISSSEEIGVGSIRYYIQNVDDRGYWVKQLVAFDRPGTFTLSETVTEYLQFQIRVGNGVTVNYQNVKTQIEAGSSATTFQPHQSQSYPINIGSIELCKIGDYQDYIYKSGDDWYVHKAVGKSMLGSLSWTAANTFDSNYKKMATSGLSGLYVPPSVSSDTIIARCSHFTPRTEQNLNNRIVGLSGRTNGVDIFAYDTDYNTSSSASGFKTWLTDNNVSLYYALTTPTETKITDATLVGQLEALSAMRSYNDQTNIIVAATGDNLPATLCVTTYRKSLDGVLDLINDTACTCKNRQGNLVIDLPNGMTTYTNDDAPLPLDEALEAFEQGRSIFFVDYNDAETGVYAVSAVNANDGIWTMKVERIGTNVSETAGYWVIETSNAAPAQWRRVDFYRYINKEPTRLNMIVDASTWNMTSATGTFMISSSLASQVSMSMTAEITVASTDVYFTDALSPGTQITLASLWSRIANGEQFDISVPYGSISSRADISPILDNRGKYGMSICNYARLDNSEMSTYSYTDSSTDTQKTISSYNSNATVDVLPSAAYEHELMKMNAPFGISKISTDGSESDTYVFFTTIFGSGQAPEDA